MEEYPFTHDLMHVYIQMYVCMNTHTCTHIHAHTHRFDYNLKVTICDLSKPILCISCHYICHNFNGFRLIYKYSKTQIPTAVHLFPLKKFILPWVFKYKINEVLKAFPAFFPFIMSLPLDCFIYKVLREKSFPPVFVFRIFHQCASSCVSAGIWDTCRLFHTADIRTVSLHCELSCVLAKISDTWRLSHTAGTDKASLHCVFSCVLEGMRKWWMLSCILYIHTVLLHCVCSRVFWST